MSHYEPLFMYSAGAQITCWDGGRCQGCGGGGGGDGNRFFDGAAATQEASPGDLND